MHCVLCLLVPPERVSVLLSTMQSRLSLRRGGKALVEAFIALVLDKQPFSMTLASCKAVDFIKREITPVVENA